LARSKGVKGYSVLSNHAA
jgi:DNA processing protein